MNKIILTGRLAKKEEVRYTQSGQATSSFCIAVKKDFAVQQGEKDSYFFNCQCWNSKSEFLQKYIEVGDAIAITGKLQNREWIDQNNQRHLITDINCDEIEIISKKQQNQTQGQAPQMQNQVQQANIQQYNAQPNYNQPPQQYQQPVVNNQSMQPQYQVQNPTPTPNYNNQVYSNYAQPQPAQAQPQYQQPIPQQVYQGNAQPNQQVQMPTFNIEIEDGDLPF